MTLLVTGGAGFIGADIKPSHRGELEITDVNKRYLELNQLNAETLQKLAQPLAKNGYGQYLLNLLK